MINYTRAFDLAWERMLVILFRPFDAGKRFTIGFSAFLAGLLSGGNGFNASYNQNTGLPQGSAQYQSNLNQLSSSVTAPFAGLQTGVIVLLGVMVFFLIMGLVVLMYWLGARGQFLLLDNVVRNRGAIAWPWRAYARQGNSLFLFYLLVLLMVLVVIVPLTILAVFLALPMFKAHRWPEGGEIPLILLLALVYVGVFVAFSVILFLFRELGVPLMFRHGLPARAAFGEMWGLARTYPGKMAAFVLLRIALFLALVVVSSLLCCVTCCVELIPYLGTVILLPAILYIKCFTLEFLAQFGPRYDVWTVDVPPGEPPAPVPSPAP